MSLLFDAESQPGRVLVKGLTRGPDPKAGTLDIGPSGSTAQVGAHLLGVDLDFASPIGIAAVYDPTRETDPYLVKALRRCQYVGYIQFLQYRFLGQPIPPSLIGGPIGSLAPYATNKDVGHRHEFVDFMSPDQFRLTVHDDAAHEVALAPFFAINSALFEQIGSIEALYSFPHSHGSLCEIANLFDRAAPVNDKALGATLIGKLWTTHLSEEQVGLAISGRPALAEGTRPPADLAHWPLVLLALEILGSQPGLAPAERAVSLASIRMGRIVGRYTLLTVANADGEEPVLCVSREENTVRVHLLSWEDMMQLERSATEEMLARIDRYFQSEAIVLTDAVAQPALPGRGRGRGGGLETRAFPRLRGRCLQLCLRTVAFGKRLHALRHGGLEPLSGFQWELRWTFDGDRRVLVREAQPTAPVPIASPASLLYDGALETFYEAVKGQSGDWNVDVSNFAQAELAGLEFGGSGGKRRFVPDED